MYFPNFDRAFFDMLIWIVFTVGVIAAAIRLYTDFSRPLPPNDDTQPHRPDQKPQRKG